MDITRSSEVLNSATQRPTTHSSRRRRNPNRATLWVAFAALAVLLPVMVVGSAVILFQTYHLNLPGVTVFDKDIGLMSFEDTVLWIDNYWNNTRQITLVSPENPGIAITLPPAELGLWVDPIATAQAAYDFGRVSDPFDDILSSLQGDLHVVMPVLYYDQAVAQKTLNALAADLNIPAENAAIVYQDGSWSAVPGSVGRAVDVPAIQQDMLDNGFTVLLSKTANLPFIPVEPSISDLSPVLDQIEAAVARDFILKAYDPITDEHFQWSVSEEIKRNWVKVNPNTYNVSLSLDIDNISQLINSWEMDLGEGRSWDGELNIEQLIERWQNGNAMTMTLRHSPTTYQVSAGESLWSISLKLGMPMYHIINANEGLTTNNVSAGMNLVIPSKNELLPLPVVPNKRIMIDISEQRMQVYENGEIRNSYIVSTGISNSPTMAGIFQVQTHEINAYASNWDLWMPHFMGIYEAVPGFMNGIHGLPLLSGGGRLWASSLGRPASYGCIILDLDAAEDLYNWAEDGVVVEIRN